MLLRPHRIQEAYWVGAGAALLVITRLIPFRQAAHAVYEGLDVYLFLTGMMVLAELAREEHVFDWAAGFAARHARKSPRRLFTLVYIVGAIVTALLSNDATAVVLTPAVLAVVRRARVDPKPYLLACAFIANAASFVLPISNPANLVVFNAQIPPLQRWLSIFLLPSLASVLFTFLCLAWMSRKQLRGEIYGEIESEPLSLGRKARRGRIAPFSGRINRLFCPGAIARRPYTCRGNSCPRGHRVAQPPSHRSRRKGRLMVSAAPGCRAVRHLWKLSKTQVCSAQGLPGSKRSHPCPPGWPRVHRPSR